LPRDSSSRGEFFNPVVTTAHEHVCVDERRHGIVLAGSFLRALAFALPGGAFVSLGWPATLVGTPLLAAAAFVALRAVWLWERTRVVLTDERLVVLHGTLRRRAAAVRLSRIGPVELEQSLLGRLLDYGTIIAGDLEVTHVPAFKRVAEQLPT
jgi:PH (Pleckstrin Homology) domain-containing protein